jgi:predicted nucleic acid-binding protein
VEAKRKGGGTGEENPGRIPEVDGKAPPVMKAFIDADILIWHLRGEKKSLHFLKNLLSGNAHELWTGAMQRAEIVFFMRPEEERATALLLSNFRTAVVDETIIDSAAKLYRQWHPSHGIDINDAILAATAIHQGGRIFCLNRKHYPMPDVLVEKAW